MNIYRNLIVGLVALSYAQSYCTEGALPEGFVKGASYFTYEGAGGFVFPRGLPGGSKLVHFYSAEGNLILTAPHGFRHMDRKLDPSAPKPQPTHYEIKYWNPYLKGAPGYFAVFYDQNNNVIDSFRYNEETHQIKNDRKKVCQDFDGFPLDLSLICKDVK